MIIKAIVFLIFHDIWFYFFHIILHKYFYASIHKFNHSTPYEILTSKKTNNLHLIENVMSPMGVFIPFYFYRFGWSSVDSFIIASVVIISRSILRRDKRSSWLFENHHIAHCKHLNCNYGEFWLDSTFGTYCDETE